MGVSGGGGQGVEGPGPEQAQAQVIGVEQGVGDDGDLEDNQDHNPCNKMMMNKLKYSFPSFLMSMQCNGRPPTCNFNRNCWDSSTFRVLFYKSMYEIICKVIKHTNIKLIHISKRNKTRVPVLI